MKLVEKQVVHSYTIEMETGHINVRLDTIILDEDTGEVKARSPWRGVIDPGDTDKALSLLKDDATDIMNIAGKHLGGWQNLEVARENKLKRNN